MRKVREAHAPREANRRWRRKPAVGCTGQRWGASPRVYENTAPKHTHTHGGRLYPHALTDTLAHQQGRRDAPRMNISRSPSHIPFQSGLVLATQPLCSSLSPKPAVPTPSRFQGSPDMCAQGGTPSLVHLHCPTQHHAATLTHSGSQEE